MQNLNMILNGINQTQSTANLQLFEALNNISTSSDKNQSAILIDNSSDHDKKNSPFTNRKIQKYIDEGCQYETPKLQEDEQSCPKIFIRKAHKKNSQNSLYKNQLAMLNPESEQANNQSYYLKRKDNKRNINNKLKKLKTEADNNSKKKIINRSKRQSYLTTEPSSEKHSRENLEKVAQLKVIFERKNKLYHKLQKLNMELKKLARKQEQQSLSPIHEDSRKKSPKGNYSFFKNKKNKYKKLPDFSTSKNNSRMINHDQQDQLFKSKRAIQFIEKVSKESFERRMKHQKKINDNIKHNILSHVCMDCSRMKCRGQVIQGEFGEFEHRS